LHQLVGIGDKVELVITLCGVVYLRIAYYAGFDLNENMLINFAVGG